MKQVLLTGATGFIGSQVTKELLRRGYEVHALVYPPFAPEQPNFIQHEMNLLDASAVEHFMAEHNFENPPDYRKYVLHEKVSDQELNDFYSKFPHLKPT